MRFCQHVLEDDLARCEVLLKRADRNRVPGRHTRHGRGWSSHPRPLLSLPELLEELLTLGWTLRPHQTDLQTRDRPESLIVHIRRVRPFSRERPQHVCHRTPSRLFDHFVGARWISKIARGQSEVTFVHVAPRADQTRLRFAARDVQHDGFDDVRRLLIDAVRVRGSALRTENLRQNLQATWEAEDCPAGLRFGDRGHRMPASLCQIAARAVRIGEEGLRIGEQPLDGAGSCRRDRTVQIVDCLVGPPALLVDSRELSVSPL